MVTDPVAVPVVNAQTVTAVPAEVTEYDVTASDVEAGIGQEIIMFTPDGQIEENPLYVVSAKSVEVIDHEGRDHIQEGEKALDAWKNKAANKAEEGD